MKKYRINMYDLEGIHREHQSLNQKKLKVIRRPGSLYDLSNRIIKLEKRIFVDFTHGGTGRMCTMYYYPRIKQFKLEPIEKNGRKNKN